MSRTDEALASLVVRGTLSDEQAQEVRAALDQAGQAREHGRRRILSEILSYVGGAVIVVSAAFIVGQAWEPLGAPGRSGLILGIAAILFVVGWVLGGRIRDDSERRLSSTLMTAGAVLTAVAVGIAVDALLGNPLTEGPDVYAYEFVRPWAAPFTILCAAASALAVAVAGYLRSRSALGHVALGTAATLTIFSAGWVVNAMVVGTSDDFPVFGALLVMATGAAWLVASLRGVFEERLVGQFVGMTAMLFGVQGLRGDTPFDWLTPVLLVAGGLALMAVYGWLRQWPLLVGGVAGVILGGTELLVTYTEGIVAALGSLLLGLTMLAAGLRLLRERRPPA